MVQNIPPPPGFNTWTLQPAVSHYTSYTLPLLCTSQNSSHSVYKNDGSDTVITFTNNKHWAGLAQRINGDIILCKEFNF
jgi:hypothetical protein